MEYNILWFNITWGQAEMDIYFFKKGNAISTAVYTSTLYPIE
jgi:hypothetical protein